LSRVIGSNSGLLQASSYEESDIDRDKIESGLGKFFEKFAKTGQKRYTPYEMMPDSGETWQRSWWKIERAG
jgi:hypothetical protein